MISDETLPVGTVVHQTGQSYRTMFPLIVVCFTPWTKELATSELATPEQPLMRRRGAPEEAVEVCRDALQISSPQGQITALSLP